MRNCFLILLVLATSSSTFSQYDSLCRKDITDYLDKNYTVNLSQPVQNCFFDYSVKTDFNSSSGIAPQLIKFKVYSTSSLLVIESNLISIYVDKNDSYIIMHDQKLINRTDGIQHPSDKQNVKDLFAQQLQLINSSNILNCVLIQEDNKNCRLTAFKLNDELTKNQHINSLEVFFDLDKELVYKVVTHYTGDSQIRKQTITYNTVNYNYQVKLKGTAKGRVLDSNSNLLPKYKGYTFL